MSHLDLLSTIHTPVTADGREIKNSFGIVIATMMFNDPFATQAMCDLINMGAVTAKSQNDEHAAQERKIHEMFRRSLAADHARNPIP